VYSGPSGLQVLAAAATNADMLLTPASTDSYSPVAAVTTAPTSPDAHLLTTVPLLPGTTDLPSTVTTPDGADGRLSPTVAGYPLTTGNPSHTPLTVQSPILGPAGAAQWFDTMRQLSPPSRQLIVFSSFGLYLNRPGLLYHITTPAPLASLVAQHPAIHCQMLMMTLLASHVRAPDTIGYYDPAVAGCVPSLTEQQTVGGGASRH